MQHLLFFSLQLVVIHFLPKGENLHSKHSGFVWVFKKIYYLCTTP